MLTDVWRDSHGLDEYVALSHRYRVRLLPVLMGRVPLWVTEHGYPGDSAYQCDPRFRGGEAAQAAYLRRSLPTLRAPARRASS